MKIAVMSLYRTGSKLLANQLAEQNSLEVEHGALSYAVPNASNVVDETLIDLENVTDNSTKVLQGHWDAFNSPLLADIKTELDTNYTIHTISRDAHDFVYSAFIFRHIRDNFSLELLRQSYYGQSPSISPFTIDLTRITDFANYIQSQYDIAETFTISETHQYSSFFTEEELSAKKAYLRGNIINIDEVDEAIATQIMPIVSGSSLNLLS